MQCGEGNPQHPSGYRTGYFWEEVLQRDSFLDILGHFVFIEKTEEKVDDGQGGHRRIVKEAMIFPCLLYTSDNRRKRRSICGICG